MKDATTTDVLEAGVVEHEANCIEEIDELLKQPDITDKQREQWLQKRADYNGRRDTYQTRVQWEHVKDYSPVNYDLPLQDIRRQAIEHTKNWARRMCEQGVVFRDGKRYTATPEKQGLLQNQLMYGTLLLLKGDDPDGIVLRWNEKGQESADWKYADLALLSEAIRMYAGPIAEKQRRTEAMLLKAGAIEEIQSILDRLEQTEEEPKPEYAYQLQDFAQNLRR